MAALPFSLFIPRPSGSDVSETAWMGVWGPVSGEAPRSSQAAYISKEYSKYCFPDHQVFWERS